MSIVFESDIKELWRQSVAFPKLARAYACQFFSKSVMFGGPDVLFLSPQVVHFNLFKKGSKGIFCETLGRADLIDTIF